jgi:hypothetical protein
VFYNSNNPHLSGWGLWSEHSKVPLLHTAALAIKHQPEFWKEQHSNHSINQNLVQLLKD